MNLIKNVEELGWRGRMERRYTSGRVVDIDVLRHTATVDTGAADTAGNPVYLTNIAFKPQTPPRPGDTVMLAYAGSSPHSLYIAAGALSGGTAQSEMTVAGAVSSLTASGGAALKGDITLAAGANVALTETGQTITIAANGAAAPAVSVTPVGPAGVVGTGMNYARQDHAHQGVHGLGVSGQALLSGEVVLSAGSNITLTQQGQSIAVAASTAGGGTGWTRQTTLVQNLPYQPAAADQIVIVENGAVTAQGQPWIVLPSSAANAGRCLLIKNGTGGAAGTPVTVYAALSGTDKFDGSTAQSQLQINPLGATAFNAVEFVSDGAGNWWAVSSYA